MSEKKPFSRFNQPVPPTHSSALQKPFYKKIFLPLLGIMAGYALSFIPVGHTHSATPVAVNNTIIHDTMIHYIPHQAPKSSYLGKYENEKGTFHIKEDTTRDITITEHQWRLDTITNRYLTIAKGFIKAKQKNSKIKEGKLILHEYEDYNLLNPHAAPFETIKIPDMNFGTDPLLVASLKAEGIYSRQLWISVSPEHLPYKFTSSRQEYTVEAYGTKRDTLVPNVFVTFLVGTKRDLDGKGPAKAFTLTETRTITE